VNGAIEAWIKEQPRMTFINVFPAMLGTDGLPKPDIFLEDRLHMNAGGLRNLEGNRRADPAQIIFLFIFLLNRGRG